MNSTPDHDGDFVDGLLRQAQAALDDPRIQFVHVRHAGPPPSDAPDTQAPGGSGAASVVARSAWTQTVETATTLRDLWEHAWLPDPPMGASVRYLEDSAGPRVEVTGHCDTSEAIDVDTAADRLIVRGFLPDDAHAPGRLRARNGGRELVVDSTLGGLSMTLSEPLELTEQTTLGGLVSLPEHVSLISDGL